MEREAVMHAWRDTYRATWAVGPLTLAGEKITVHRGTRHSICLLFPPCIFRKEQQRERESADMAGVRGCLNLPGSCSDRFGWIFCAEPGLFIARSLSNCWSNPIYSVKRKHAGI
jgi:hypothetical protein